MKGDKLSASFAPDLGDAVRAASRQRGGGVSRWLADAAAAKLRTEALADFLDAWEAEHGSLTAAELAQAAVELAVPKPAAQSWLSEFGGARCRGLRRGGPRGPGDDGAPSHGTASGTGLRSTGVVITQVWRDPAGRQANLAQLLESVDVRAVDDQLGREAGVLLGRAGTKDAVDASVVAVCATGDRILTGDAGDIRPLVAASGRSILVIPC
ncbi:MAG: hypothetical protein M3486_01610 [Actinomycetota bacterium]|jgi:hypothetical protein|nr:hypothetical protein [Actinomycetota bacterium]